MECRRIYLGPRGRGFGENVENCIRRDFMNFTPHPIEFRFPNHEGRGGRLCVTCGRGEGFSREGE